MEIPNAMIEAVGKIIQDGKWGYESPEEFIRESVRMNLMRFI
ncbi:hypothetical protein V7O67_05270 [Methanolobus sp. ZRKC4]